MQTAKGEAESLQELRVSRSLTIDNVAEVLGIDRSFVTYLEHGKRTMSLERAGQFADLYGVDVNMILSLLKKTKQK